MTNSPEALFGHYQQGRYSLAASKTEVAESPIPSHTDVVADQAQRTNYILFNVGIGTCLDDIA